jgi:hypothetical protein
MSLGTSILGYAYRSKCQLRLSVSLFVCFLLQQDLTYLRIRATKQEIMVAVGTWRIFKSESMLLLSPH